MNAYPIAHKSLSSAPTTLEGVEDVSLNLLNASWRRSSSFGLDPNGKPIDAVISEADLSQINQKK
jgi:hypothetical protein